MRTALKLHPDSRRHAVRQIEVEIARVKPELLSVRYIVIGDLDGLVMPFPGEPGRADGLWRHTCFEAFVGRIGGAYDEFNFAPSGQWAAYDFGAYRAGMRPLDVAPPRIAMKAEERAFQFEATFTVREGAARLGLCVVIEEDGGSLSYWALAHSPGKPDFHHPDCFALQLPAMQRS